MTSYFKLLPVGHPLSDGIELGITNKPLFPSVVLVKICYHSNGSISRTLSGLGALWSVLYTESTEVSPHSFSSLSESLGYYRSIQEQASPFPIATYSVKG